VDADAGASAPAEAAASAPFTPKKKSARKGEPAGK